MKLLVLNSTVISVAAPTPELLLVRLFDVDADEVDADDVDADDGVAMAQHDFDTSTPQCHSNVAHTYANTWDRRRDCVFFFSQATLKGLYPKGLTLLGFRPVKTLRSDYNVRSPYFLYPDEDSTAG